MYLKFQRSHLSITSFPDIELPDFTLITGPNGAGKTHLLQALKNGLIKTDFGTEVLPSRSGDIRLFDWTNMVPQDSGNFTSETLRLERSNRYQRIKNTITNSQTLENLRHFARTQGLPNHFVDNPLTLALTSAEERIQLLGSKENAELLAQIIDSIDQTIKHSDEGYDPTLDALSRALKKPIMCLTEHDVLTSGVQAWGSTNLFQQSFARLFVAYRDLVLENKLARLDASDGDPTAKPLTDEDFRTLHGPPPWDFVNKVLTDSGFDFEINSPSLRSATPFQPTLSKKSNGLQIAFSGLSSGEKVLMSFAFCTYYANDRRQVADPPKLILLDEVDAPLHPSMSRNLIAAITETLVRSFKVKVIATTHSPSTVALAPEESIYVMRPGEPGLRKTSKAEALNILTVGVPTIAISYDGRRQVFVESPSDAKIYDSLYKLLKSKLPPERSLEFIATGTRSAAGTETNTGCDIVKRLVTDLATSGNQSVFGLLDWDNSNTSTGRIAILAHGKRNGIENVLLDPLLVAAHICRDFSDEKARLGLKNVNWIEFATAPTATLQGAADAVVAAVLGNKDGPTVSCRYIGGHELMLDQRYLLIDDHELEARLLNTFHCLKRHLSGGGGTAGKLMSKIISTVCTDQTGFIPVEIRDAFVDLLSRPAHPGS
jgi:ABC-type branched-subunit amino acid transport system ATPase component